MKRRHLLGMTAALAGLASACTITEGPIDETEDLGPVSITDLGSDTVDTTGETEVTVEVPAGAQSFALVVDGAGSNLVQASQVTSPSGTVVYDFFAEPVISTNRTDATDGLYTLLVPTNPAVTVEEGDWVIKLLSDGSFDASMKAVIKNEPAKDFLLDLNLYFVGLDGLDGTSAQGDAGFQAILSSIGSMYGQAGFNIRAINYFNITGSDADTYGVIDSDAELAGLFKLSPSESNISLNLFLVSDIAIGGGGFTILGLAGGVPGPPVLQGTSRSGVAVNMGSYLAAVASGDQTMIDEAVGELEIIMAHESGHFLGLYHTVERNGVALDSGGTNIHGEDPLSDTAACADASDADADGVLDPSECAGQGAENLMFWSPANDSRTLTGQQGKIMLANPLVH